jgi:hypothetical protein
MALLLYVALVAVYVHYLRVLWRAGSAGRTSPAGNSESSVFRWDVRR